MDIFGMYFGLGVHHIADFAGYDHILFLVCLTAVYLVKDWKRILILITAFTIGHTVSLVLATFNVVHFSGSWIEFLIPLTIFITGLWNVVDRNDQVSRSGHNIKYAAALFFGLIHGLGFSNFLRSLLGAEDNLALPLLGFNLGIESGQIIIVTAILTLAYFAQHYLRIVHREWNLILSGAGMGIAMILMGERWPM
jgi:hypothetical protein